MESTDVCSELWGNFEWAEWFWPRVTLSVSQWSAFKIFRVETGRKRMQENGKEILCVCVSVSELQNEFKN